MTMTESKIKPASDAEIVVWGQLHGITSMSHHALIARITAEKALREELEATLEAHTESEAANCPEDQSCIDTIKALRAKLEKAEARVKALEEEVERLQKELKGTREWMTQSIRAQHTEECHNNPEDLRCYCAKRNGGGFLRGLIKVK